MVLFSSGSIKSVEISPFYTASPSFDSREAVYTGTFGENCVCGSTHTVTWSTEAQQYLVLQVDGVDQMLSWWICEHFLPWKHSTVIRLRGLFEMPFISKLMNFKGEINMCYTFLLKTIQVNSSNWEE